MSPSAGGFHLTIVLSPRRCRVRVVDLEEFNAGVERARAAALEVGDRCEVTVWDATAPLQGLFQTERSCGRPVVEGSRLCATHEAARVSLLAKLAD